MSTPARKKGTSHETAVVNWLHEHGWRHARRYPAKGNRDEGDIALGDGIPVTVEAKNRARMDLAGFIGELEAEMINAGTETGCVVIKRRGTTNVAEFYALTTFAQWNDLVARAYGNVAPLTQPVKRRRRLVKAIDIDTDS